MRKKKNATISFPCDLPTRCRACGCSEGLKIQISTVSFVYRCGRCDLATRTTRIVKGEEVEV